MSRLVVYIPREHPPGGPGQTPRRVDLSHNSPVRRLMTEARILGVDVEVDPLLTNQVGEQAQVPA